MADMPVSVIYKDWATKEGQKHRSWRRRLFVLFSDSSLRYYKSERDANTRPLKPLGEIRIDSRCQILRERECTTAWPSEYFSAGEQGGFGIRTPKRTLYMFCDTAARAMKWVEVLTTFKASFGVAASTSSRVRPLSMVEDSTANSSSEEEADETPDDVSNADSSALQVSNGFRQARLATVGMMGMNKHELATVARQMQNRNDQLAQELWYYRMHTEELTQDLMRANQRIQQLTDALRAAKIPVPGRKTDSGDAAADATSDESSYEADGEMSDAELVDFTRQSDSKAPPPAELAAELRQEHAAITIQRWWRRVALQRRFNVVRVGAEGRGRLRTIEARKLLTKNAGLKTKAAAARAASSSNTSSGTVSPAPGPEPHRERLLSANRTPQLLRSNTMHAGRLATMSISAPSRRLTASVTALAARRPTLMPVLDSEASSSEDSPTRVPVGKAVGSSPGAVRPDVAESGSPSKPAEKKSSASTATSTQSAAPPHHPSTSPQTAPVRLAETESSEVNRLCRAAIYRFNRSPKKGIHDLQHAGLVTNNPAEAIQFLIEEPQINRRAFGDLLADADQPGPQLLEAYCNQFDFVNAPLDTCLRLFLLSFRIPGEAQKIERVLTAFARRFHMCNPGAFSHEDTALVLAFSVMMLHTDLHNPSNPRKMTPDQFVRNNRGIDDGHNIPEEYLRAIYTRIQSEEFQTCIDNTFRLERLADQVHAKPPFPLVTDSRIFVADVPASELYRHKSSDGVKRQLRLLLFNDLLLACVPVRMERRLVLKRALSLFYVQEARRDPSDPNVVSLVGHKRATTDFDPPSKSSNTDAQGAEFETLLRVSLSSNVDFMQVLDDYIKQCNWLVKGRHGQLPERQFRVGSTSDA